MTHFSNSRRLLGLVLFMTAASTCAWAQDPAPASEVVYYEGKSGTDSKGIEWVKAIAVSNPAYCSEIKGDVEVRFQAPGMTHAKAMCWQQPTPENPDPFGHDVTVAPDIKLGLDGSGSFTFPADKFPAGPITLRIYAKDDGKKQDTCEIQLFNKGGVAWNQGIPKNDPPAAAGMKLVFADDFDGPLSITNDGNGAKYQSHKTGGGDFSGWPFSDNDGEMNPFSQVGTYLRIHASKHGDGKSSSGILSSAHEDGSGVYAKAPCYFECRFIAHSAPGTWPAFWLLTKNSLSKDKAERDLGTDEMDIIEAYGGQGKGNPNFPNYAVTSHYWGQKKADGTPLGDDHVDVKMMDLGGKSSWSTTFHTYGMLLTETECTYYFDDIPVFKHSSKPLTKTQPFWFLINYAIGGISGWKIDLDRYGNQTDMWVDYVRVYEGTPGTTTTKN